jgi:hypothetical protein
LQAVWHAAAGVTISAPTGEFHQLSPADFAAMAETPPKVNFRAYGPCHSERSEESRRFLDSSLRSE